MKFLSRKITIAQALLILMIPVSLMLYIVYNSILEELEIRRVYSKCKFIEHGMKISKMYEILDTHIMPEVKIEYIYYTKSYHHYIIFPMPLNTDIALKMEIDEKTQTIINFNPNNCSY